MNTLTQATPTTTNGVIESDLQQHIEDTRLFWVTRSGRQVERAWNELTITEWEQIREAERRATYNAMFSPCYC
jgi:hypothetical protein